MKTFSRITISKKLQTSFLALLTTTVITSFSSSAFAVCSSTVGSVSNPGGAATVNCANSTAPTINVADGNDSTYIIFDNTTAEGNVNIDSNENNFTVDGSSLVAGGSGNRIDLTGADENLVQVRTTTINEANGSTSSLISLNTFSDFNRVNIEDGGVFNVNNFISKAIEITGSSINEIDLEEDATINLNGSSTYGIYISSNSNDNTVDLRDTSSISATGASNTKGVLVSTGTGNTINLRDNSVISSTGTSNSNGIRIESDSDENNIMLVTNARIQTSGDGSDGIAIFDRSDDNEITLNAGTDIQTTGVGSHGISISQYTGLATTESTGNTVSVNEASIITIGNSSSAIKLDGVIDNTINLFDGFLNTSGISGHAISANNAAGNLIELNNSTNILAYGATSDGINLSGNKINSVITLNDSSNISGKRYGISLESGISASEVTINVNENSSIVGEEIGISAVDTASQVLTINLDSGVVNGNTVSVTGTYGNAILTGDTEDRLFINNNVNLYGGVLAGGSLEADQLSISDANLGIDENINGFEVVSFYNTSNVFLSNIGTSDITGTGSNDTLYLIDANVTLEDGIRLVGYETIDVSGTSRFDGDLDSSGKTITLGNGATLSLNGTFSNDSFSVDTGSTFMGNNTVTGDVNILSGGRLAPGNSIGTINVIGNLVFGNGAFFDVEVDGALTDVVNVTGDVTVDPGATLNITQFGSQYTGSSPFLTATGDITGEWQIVNFNGQATAVLYDNASTPETHTLVAALVNVNGSLPNAVAFATAQNIQTFTETVGDKSIDNVFAKGKNFWAESIYKNSNRQSTATFSGFNNNVTGFTFGFENDVAENTRAGVSFGNLYNNTNLKLGAGGIDGTAYMVGAYGTYLMPQVSKNLDLFATSAISLGYHDLNNKRTVVNSGVTSSAKSDSSAIESSALAQLGLRKALCNKWSLIPAVSLSYINVNGGSAAERAGGISNITVNDYSLATFKTTEGVTLVSQNGYNIYDDIIAKPSFELSLSQEFADGGRDYTGSFANGTPFGLKTDDSSNQFANIGFGADFVLDSLTTANLSYLNSQSTDETRNYARIGVSRKF